MPRYAIRPTKPQETIYTVSDDALDAINWSRRVLIDAAMHGNLEVVRLPDNPDVYDQERDNQLELRNGSDRDDEVAVRWGLQGRESDPNGLEAF